MIAALCEQNLIAAFTVEGACNRTVFDTKSGLTTPFIKKDNLLICDRSTDRRHGQKKVADWIAKKTGREKVWPQRGWDYLRKCRYSPQRPRPRHVKGDPIAQQEFKKN